MGKSTEALAKESHGQNPKANLSQADAVKLFESLVQKGAGLPMWLEANKPPPDSPIVSGAVEQAYAKYPDPRPKNQDGGKGGGGYDAYGGGFNPMAGMMQMMMAMNGYGQ